MGLMRKAKEKLEDAAGGVTGTDDEDADREPNEARFEPEEARRRSRPGDNLPKPEDSEPTD